MLSAVFVRPSDPTVAPLRAPVAARSAWPASFTGYERPRRARTHTIAARSFAYEAFYLERSEAIALEVTAVEGAASVDVSLSPWPLRDMVGEPYGHHRRGVAQGALAARRTPSRQREAGGTSSRSPRRAPTTCACGGPVEHPRRRRGRRPPRGVRRAPQPRHRLHGHLRELLRRARSTSAPPTRCSPRARATCIEGSFLFA